MFHLIFSGPSTAGKTSLMLGLSEADIGEYSFTVDRTWTTRSRRPSEGDEENVFVTAEEFDSKRDDFLFTFQTFPTYEYGIEIPGQLDPDEIRMRILMPVHAIMFREMVEEPTVFCAVSPLSKNAKQVFDERDPEFDPEDSSARLQRFFDDITEANSAADICFQNTAGLELAVLRLGQRVVNYAQCHSAAIV